MNCLARNAWPGNVRELSNLLERLAILFPQQTIRAEDLPDRYRRTGAFDLFGHLARADVDQPLRPGTRSIAAALPEILDDEVLADHVLSAAVAERNVAIGAPNDDSLDAELPQGGIDLKDHLSAIEIGLIRKALVEADGTVAEAARLLRMRRTTLVEKLRKYRLTAA
jgi:sigma-54 specific flagellar transcriptional regulator A